MRLAILALAAVGAASLGVAAVAAKESPLSPPPPKGAGLATVWQETLILMGMTCFLLVKGSRGLAIRLG